MISISPVKVLCNHRLDQFFPHNIGLLYKTKQSPWENNCNTYVLVSKHLHHFHVISSSYTVKGITIPQYRKFRCWHIRKPGNPWWTLRRPWKVALMMRNEVVLKVVMPLRPGSPMGWKKIPSSNPTISISIFQIITRDIHIVNFSTKELLPGIMYFFLDCISIDTDTVLIIIESYNPSWDYFWRDQNCINCTNTFPRHLALWECCVEDKTMSLLTLWREILPWADHNWWSGTW